MAFIDLRSVLWFALIWLGFSPGLAPAADEPAPRLDAIAGAAVREHRSVGIAAAVVRGKEPLLLKAYGQAEVETDTPMTVDTIIPIASVTKQFTAAAILQLRDQEKLSLDDAITKWLPDFEAHGHHVTLRHLLGHTSGLTELGAMQELRAVRLMTNPTFTRDDVYDVIKRQPFSFPPGTMQAYRNTNYWLLGRIVEKASGLSYEDYIEQKIFAPLGMTRSRFGPNAQKLPRLASGYGLRSGSPRAAPKIVHTGTFAAGAIASTVEDMITWLQALHGGKVLSPRSYAEMIAPARLNDGTVTCYGLGLSVAEDSHGLAYIGHSGGGFGFSSEARWYPEAKLAIVLLTNSEPDTLTAATEEIAATLLPAPRAAGPFTGDASLLVGSYKGPGGRGEMRIEVTQMPQGIAFAIDGALAEAQPWAKDWTFRRRDALLIFRRKGNTGPASELHYDIGGGHFILQRH